MKLPLIVTWIAASVTLSCAARTETAHARFASAQFNWTAIYAESQLQYHSCYDGFECARLRLPLDYNNSSSVHNISLAVIRLPAQVSEDDPSHGGSIILNPGGPGGSGIQFALAAARSLQEGLGSDGGKQFEIVSFDPRGILYSKPNLYCFATPFDAQLWQHEKLAKGALDESEAAFHWQWEFEMARGRVCEQSDVGKWDRGVDLRQYVSSAFVARDMLELAKAIDHRKQIMASFVMDLQQDWFKLDQENTPKLQYYGQSYGTFLGQLFASMYPEHVGSMVLDGNIDGDNWVSDHEYSVDDSGAIRAYFFESCFAAGRLCPFWGLVDDAAEDQEQRYNDMIARLAEKPALINLEGRTVLLTPDRLEKAFFTASYQPSEYFPRLAQLLLDIYSYLECGDPLDYTDIFWEQSTPTMEDFATEEVAHLLQNDEIAAFVHCADGPDLTDHNTSSFKAHLDDLVDKFPHVAAEQANYKLPCWTMSPFHRTRWRYEGSFGSHDTPPILFLNNRLDVATPAKSARKMAGRFKGSKLVVSGNIGHVALWKGGDCVWDHARRYFVDGLVPEEEAWCEGMRAPFKALDTSEGVSLDRFAT